jgi:hypothetical protein
MPKKTKPPQALDMTREYRAELKDLRRNRAKVARDLVRDHRITLKAGRQLAREMKQRERALHRDYTRRTRAAAKVLATLDRRVGILEGRLS